ncbi:MAG TPA: pilus assembly protein FilA, partial [Acinetobacter sp.]|nr:pilus assembly protein FilA [Acinetobacter sp.]
MNKIFGCLSLFLTPFAIAMQPLDDQSLSTATGQDGLNIGVNVSKIEFKQISVIDSDGWDTQSAAATEYRGRAGL